MIKSFFVLATMAYQVTMLLLMMVVFLLSPTHGAGYSDITQLFQDKLGSSSGYNTAVRPVLDQSQTVYVSVNFEIIAIVEVDDIKENFIVNGFLNLSWTDEILTWNPADYNSLYDIVPYPKDIWRPRLVLGNTLDDRDLFEDDYCPTQASYNGSVNWFPGSLFPTSCKLDLLKYPFDEQLCTIDLYSMVVTPGKISFQCPTPSDIGRTFYAGSGEWKIISARSECSKSNNLAFFQARFHIQRRPGFFVMNIILPVVLLSFLNIMVFLIPVESGEKISYSITVLLALTVFMSIVSEMLPRSSDVLPLVTVYLMVLLLISVFSVLMTIFIVSIHHRDEKETKRLKASSTFKGIFNKVKIFNTATAPLKHVHPEEGLPPVDDNAEKASTMRNNNHTMIDVMKNLRNLKKTVPMATNQEKESKKCDKHEVNRWRLVSRHIDCVSLVVFITIWISVTIGFLVEMSS